MGENEFDRALTYADSAIKLLKRGEIPPYPQFYELLYTYATGVNPGLNNKINEILENDEQPTVDVAEKLYNEFLRSNDVNERLSSVSRRMSAQIDDVHGAIDDAMASATSYSGSLLEATGDLDKEIDPSTLKALTQRLIAETQQMQDTNRKLEDKLASSREDMASLQHDLDEVRRESMLDPLTKIFNRKSFDEGLNRAIQDCTKSGDPLSLVMLDIDHFKQFNDNYGHQTGDQVIRLVASTLKSSIKGTDMPARYGGEEFVAILPNTDLAGAITVSESIRKSIQSKELMKRSTNEKLGRITASFGVATWESNDIAGSLIERADRCLYAAKRTGRNKVVSQNDSELNEIEAA